MSDPTQHNYSFLTTAIQAVGIMLVAGLLLPMTRAIPGRFLRYWSVGWVCLTIALFSLFGSSQIRDGAPAFLAVYCVSEYLFGFMLWAGCREFATGQPIRPVHFLALMPLVLFGLGAPVILAGANVAEIYTFLFPFHALLFGLLFLFSLLATRHYHPRPHTPSVGLWLLRISLGLLALLFVHHGLVKGYLAFVDPSVTLGYLAFSPLYDVLLETGLAFGMVVVATDRLRSELEEKNRQLEAAAEELAHAAHTDALTGLLNRRAFDEMTQHPDGIAAGSLAVLDLNDLKQINDRSGHPAGDVALQLVARALRMQFRVTDPLFRMGGDEFVVMTPALPVSELAARLRQVDLALLGLRLPGVMGATDLIISWGVASFRSADELTDAYHKADEAMYHNKKQRKSGVVAAP